MRQQQDGNTFPSPEFTRRIPQAIIQAERTYIASGSGNEMIDGILADPQAREVAENLLEDIQPKPEPGDLRVVAGALAIGSIAGLQLGTAAVPVPHHARAWIKEKAMLGIGACFGLLVWDISSDLKLWQILAALALVLGIAGLVYRITRKHTARAIAEFLTSGRG